MMAALKESRKNLGHLKYMNQGRKTAGNITPSSPKIVDLEALVSGRKKKVQN
jgi:hypothetical protein